MKCLCGYEAGYVWEEDERVKRGDEDFLRLQNSSANVQGRGMVFAIYMCPKCGTLQAEEDW